ncbi:APC family permease [Kitasatospora atroaurantiaca]|uniref:Amino acid/polyamine/organocation transporter (APC superfamily) n=1 Tax=Kitasatospora atroaurantiaca TaxID=285545 RepID=A0A561ET30_9ACTN|nr:APC family permease [Kitasatospora atroaurantiaca]TWE18758.1 amino acid/polyamine/organocation transporter (APC superfamily) [Kitasatospora atroaurantiaca]
MSAVEDTTATQDPPNVQRLKANSVGLAGVIFMALATAAPITAMTGNLPVIVGGGNGVHAPAGFLFVTVVLTVFTIGYVAMARHITTAGAFYGFVSHGLGRVVGMASGLLAVLAYVVFEASIVGIFAYFAEQTFAAQFGIHWSWQVYALAMLAVTAVLSYFDLEVASKVLGVFLAGEVVMLVLLAGSVLVHGGGPGGLHVGTLNPTGAFAGVNAGVGLFFCFWSWIGFESTAMYGEESRNPKRIIPRATLLAVLALGVLYTFVSWMVLSGNGPADSLGIATGSSPLDLFLAPAQTYLGHWAVTAFQWLMCTSAFACGMAFHQCASRYLYAIGREGFLHPALGRTHPRHGSPHIASFTQTAVALAIVGGFWAAGQDPYVSLYTLTAILGTLALLVVQTLCSFSVIVYFRRHHPESRHWFRTFTAPLLGGLGMLAAIVLLVVNLDTAAGAASEIFFFKLIPWIVGAVFAGGIALALYMRARHPQKYEVMGRLIVEDAQERTDEAAPVTV